MPRTLLSSRSWSHFPEIAKNDLPKLARSSPGLLSRDTALMTRTAPLLLVLLSLGCEEVNREFPELFGSVPALARVDLEPGAPVGDQEQLGPIARHIAARLIPPPLDQADNAVDCGRVAAMSSPISGTEELVLANVDVRTQTKNLIPRRVMERLETGEPSLLASVIDTPAQESSKPGQGSPLSASTLTRDDLARIGRQRYLGTFYVRQYQGPALILRIGKIRREWFEGSLTAKFVLFDTQSRTVICATDVHAKNDVSGAPIRSRLQAETRNRLERALGDALRQQAQRTIARVAPELKWPADSTGVTALN